MTHSVDLKNLPQSDVKPKRRMRFSVVWIIPVVAGLVGLGIAVQQILSKGPKITIVFKTAEGVEAGKTFVKYKDVNIGRVETVKLSRDFTKVVVTAKIDKSAEGLIVEDAKFWVESPRATLSGVSGIGTLLSGNYIGLEPGKSKKERREFNGLDEPPAITFDEPGKRFMLQTASLGSIGNGSPLYYRQLNVGQVIGYDLATDGGLINVEVFVRAPYDKYVTEQTRFWQASGIDVSLGTDGLSLRTQSMLSMIIGGIAFETPPSAEKPNPAAEKAVFALFSSRTEALANPERVVTRYVLYFKESLRGLSAGAPVTFAGLPVGEVTDVGLEYDPASENVRPRVDIAMYPSRFLEHMKESNAAVKTAQSEKDRHAFMQRMINRGLRAQLRNANFVTGKLYVALDLFPNASRVKKLDWKNPPYEFPVMQGSLQDLETKVNSILAEIEKLPLSAIGEEARETLGSLNVTIKDANRMLARIDGEIVPEVKTTVQDLRKAISAAERVLTSADSTLVGKEAPAQQELRVALQEIAKAARAINVLADYLERHPDALLRGKAREELK